MKQSLKSIELHLFGCGIIIGCHLIGNTKMFIRRWLVIDARKMISRIFFLETRFLTNFQTKNLAIEEKYPDFFYNISRHFGTFRGDFRVVKKFELGSINFFFQKTNKANPISSDAVFLVIIGFWRRSSSMSFMLRVRKRGAMHIKFLEIFKMKDSYRENYAPTLERDPNFRHLILAFLKLSHSAICSKCHWAILSCQPHSSDAK